MKGIPEPGAGNSIGAKIDFRAKNPRISAAILAEIALALGMTTAQIALPAGLESPDRGVICNRQRAVCYDRYGASIGLTEAFLGQIAARRLTASSPSSGAENQPQTPFSPADGVECVRKSGPCRLQGEPHAALTAALYAPQPLPIGQTSEMRAIMYGEWNWQRTRYKDNTEAIPSEPGHFVLHFQTDGFLRAQVDCNSAGGTYVFEKSRITVKLTNSTLMSCQPGSLEGVFQQDLAAVTAYSMKSGRLLLALENDGGIMEFDRPAITAMVGP
jgi:heat shock protein HslJ